MNAAVKNRFARLGPLPQFLRRATPLNGIALVLAAIGITCIAAGAWRFFTGVDNSAVMDSTAAAALDNIGRLLRGDLARVVRPAMDRTQKIAADPQVAAAILKGNRQQQTEACNAAIADSTEIDAVALFDRAGRILAINSIYASGQPIASERIERILRKSFDNRAIVQKCVRNTADERVLEFQTTCDITPALFDSTGLSIAYSVPVRDPATGQKIGVVSSRLRFERLTDLVKSRDIGGRTDSIEFVTDQGGYFSEEINSGRAAPPVAPSVLAGIVAPLAAGAADYCFTHTRSNYLLLFRLKDFVTLAGGGIQVMVAADESWLASEARQSRDLASTRITAAGLLVLLIAGLIRGIDSLRRAQRSLRTELDERQRANSTLQREIEERTRAEKALEETHQQLMAASRRAGMAEIATGVLHNVGNVLNSVNVSATLVLDGIRRSQLDQLSRVCGLLEQHDGDLGTFLSQDRKGKQIPGFLKTLSAHLAEEQSAMLREIASLGSKVEHIKTIVSTQQSYAGTSGMIEPVDVHVMLDDGLKLNSSSFERHHIHVLRDYANLPALLLDKQKVLQILVNLVKNAKDALLETGFEKRELRLETKAADGDRLRIVVRDTGVGIPPENLTRIFSHGFTTKQKGHGFGLHSCAITAREMGGSLSVESEGIGRGATFTLELPYRPAQVAAAEAYPDSSLASLKS